MRLVATGIDSFVDIDELSEKTRQYYEKACALDFYTWAREILTGSLTCEMIETNQKYEVLRL